VYPVDHALMGVVVPPGEKDLILEYRSNYFVAGLIGSLLTLLACVVVILWGSAVRRGGPLVRL
jgi:uncharacterized membrane protein YfhO